jgi:hypothetical protein
VYFRADWEAMPHLLSDTYPWVAFIFKVDQQSIAQHEPFENEYYLSMDPSYKPKR